MGLLFWQKPKPLLNDAEKKLVVEAIRDAEIQTSGELRVFVESRCSFVDPLDRAKEIFFGLEMDQTELRNAVLIYIAMKDHQLAVYGDAGIHEKVGEVFWNKEVKLMLQSFNRENYAEGLQHCVTEIGKVLHHYFPYDKDTDKNELPDDIIFGR